MVAGLGDAAGADFVTVLGRQHDVHHAQLAQFVQHAPRFMAEAGSLAELPEELPEDVGQKADQDVGQHAVLFLMPDRPEREVALLDAKGRFGIRQLDVGPSQVLVAPAADVGA